MVARGTTGVFVAVEGDGAALLQRCLVVGVPPSLQVLYLLQVLVPSFLLVHVLHVSILPAGDLLLWDVFLLLPASPDLSI